MQVPPDAKKASNSAPQTKNKKKLLTPAAAKTDGSHGEDDNISDADTLSDSAVDSEPPNCQYLCSVYIYLLAAHLL